MVMLWWVLVDVVIAAFSAFMFATFARVYLQHGDRLAAAVCWVSLALGVSPLIGHAWVPPWWRFVAVGLTVALAIGLYYWERWSIRQRDRQAGSSTTR